MKQLIRSVVAWFAAISLLFSPVFAAGVQNNGEDAATPLTNEETRSDDFYTYLKSIRNYPKATETIILKSAEGHISDQKANRIDSFLGKNDVVRLEEQGYVEWSFEVSQSAVYRMMLTYHATEKSLRNPQVSVEVDGKIPYISAGSIELDKIWVDSSKEEFDIRGNQIQPESTQLDDWVNAILFDDDAMLSEAHQIYLTAGTHTIRITSVRDGISLAELKLYGEEEPKPYSELKKEYEQKGYSVVGEITTVQAEKITRKSDVQIRALSDFSDPLLVPYDVSKIRYNTMGGGTWNSSGQWVEYDITVKTSGLYALGFKYKQSLLRGAAVCRNIYLDGRIPAKEFENVPFGYTLRWTNKTIADADGNPCYLYLEAGKVHTLRIECTPGIWRELLQEVNAIYFRLTTIYRKIIMVTSPNPDELRDYNLDSQIDGLIDSCISDSKALFEIADKFDELNGKKASQSEILRRMAEQLKSFSERPDTIATRLKEFRDNIAGISVWLQSMGNQPLILDYLILGGSTEDYPRASSNLFEKFKDFFLGFFSSFTVDYNSIGANNEDAIEVWINGGRDYANIIKRMIDTYYTPKTGKNVNLSMVQGVIIEATLAGSGPEVCIEFARGYPVNLASRGALVDISGLDGFDEVAKRYTKDAFVPYTYNNGIYAVPLSQTFFMMFYRTDIFQELGLKVPETWTEFMEVAKLLQRKNMDVCLPYSTVTNQDAAAGGIGARDIFSSLLMQLGGSFYKSDLTESGLDSPEALRAFQMWTDFYAKFSFPLTMDFVSRFRSGDVPLGILGYQTYCALTAVAPEIRGLWKMTLIPGMEKENGEIDRTVGATGSAIAIFKKAKERNHVDDCWEFVKWFTQDDMQYEYASRIEALQGEAGRYAAANLNTFNMLAWSAEEAALINQQRQWLREVPETPGNYFVSRCLDNAFRMVVYRNDNVRDTLRKQNSKINEELARKAKELQRRNKK